MYAAFDLACASLWVDGPAYVVRGDHALQAPVFVENDHLGGIAEGHVRGWVLKRFRSARLCREVTDVISAVLAAYELLDWEFH